ncbi:MAG: hypothetical protein JSW06_09735 [Thermoplasmatales archaeon]|nr:MAG: hypothetical protein JSW06_09735 [Thermoplasmatales archaeon]
MKKKIIIGSIIAVVILISVSFTGVVGYSSVKSNSRKASPLFSVRTNRAIGEESKDIACDYAGKGKTTLITIPKRDDRVVLTQRVIDSIRTMDDETLERFIASVIDSAKKDKKFNDINPSRIREALFQVRNNDKPIPILDMHTDNKYPSIANCSTFGGGLNGFLKCISQLLFLILFPFIFIVEILCAIVPPRPGTWILCPSQPTI